ncbi:uncharacterized protein N7459_002279 [Penicillium hispanicum]|uniref:uncharacterized protein n=1 Tax=Penicillium hispanicum TaxID=1080232 RepID=UPI00253FB9DF|nr:uncharacterized protein N7459_002279 [Penicillium hispanicum]KAJ5591910.1 hypothetical protein N7459_002279 [Penicillium hispanicum]
MRSILILTVLASVAAAFPAALETCRQEAALCRTDADWGQPMACCVGALTCAPKNGTLGY